MAIVLLGVGLTRIKPRKPAPAPVEKLQPETV